MSPTIVVVADYTGACSGARLMGGMPKPRRSRGAGMLNVRARLICPTWVCLTIGPPMAGHSPHSVRSDAQGLSPIECSGGSGNE